MRNTKILKSCPFCGGKANIKYKILVAFYWSGEVYCRDCGVKFKRASYTPTKLDEKLIKGWNKRKKINKTLILIM